MTPEAKARVTIDALLVATGWHVCNVAQANIHAAVGVAIREFPLNNGFGFAHYMLYVNGKACGVIEAKKEGAKPTGVHVQSGRPAQGLPNGIPALRRRLPFLRESTRVETHLIARLDPQLRAHYILAPLPPSAEQPQIVAEVDRHLSVIRKVEAKVDTNLQPLQALRLTPLARTFPSSLHD